MRYHVTLGQNEYPIDVVPRASGGFELKSEGRTLDADVVVIGDTLSIRIDGKMFDLAIEGSLPNLGVVGNGKRVYLKAESARAKAASAAKGKGGAQGEGLVCSPMPGRVVKLLVSGGDEVHVGQSLVVVEAMKMENELRAERAGKVAEIFVQAGATVESGAKLVRIG